MNKSKVSVVERQGRRYGYAGKYAGTGRRVSLKDVFGRGAFARGTAMKRGVPAATPCVPLGRGKASAGGACTGTGNPSPTVMVGSAADGGVPSRHALRGEIVEPWEDVERMCSMNQERRRMREALDLNRAQLLAAQEAQRVRDRKARQKARLLEGIRTAVTVLLFLIAFYGLLSCMVTQAAGYGLGAAASLLIGGRVCG
ncbi:MAG: hypothetical protein IJA48_04130 [Oscillospiraceae bacterium]|nr:hypothetical protein [Oscillospiraceae bacterium]